MSDEINFSEALFQLQNGKRVTRLGWNGEGMWLEAQIPDKHSKMTLPYIYIKTAQDEIVPWVVSHGDLFATDWIIK